MSYVIARYTDEQKKWAFRVYMADCSQANCENVAHALGGKVVRKRFGDIISGRPEEKRTPEEVIEKISKGLRALGEEE